VSIFGKLDAREIPASPYYIAAGEYDAEVTDAQYRIKKDSDQRQLFIEYTITDEGSLFNNKRVRTYFDLVDPDLTNESFMMLPTAEQAIIQRNMTNLKRALCGFNDNIRGLGVSEDDLNDDNWEPASLKGIKVRIGISNYGPDNQSVNVKWANIVQ
jgi:hypothetical protein